MKIRFLKNIFMVSLFVITTSCYSADNDIVTFEAKLANARSLPYQTQDERDLKIKEFEALREMAVKVNGQELFIQELETMANGRPEDGWQDLAALINYTSGTKGFSIYLSQLKSLADLAETPFSFEERVDNLANKINMIEVDSTKKEEIVKDKDNLLAKLKNLYRSRGGKSDLKIGKLKDLLSNVKKNNIFQIQNEKDLIDDMIQKVETAPSLQEICTALFDKIKTGWAIDNKSVFWKEVQSFIKSLKEAKAANQITKKIENLADVLNAIKYGRGFTSEERAQAGEWLEDFVSLISAVTTDSSLMEDYSDRLDHLMSLVQDSQTFTDADMRTNFLKDLEDVVDKRADSTEKDLKQLQAIITFVADKSQFTGAQKTKISDLQARAKIGISYPDQVTAFTTQLATVSSDEQEAFLKKVTVLLNKIIKDIKEGKTVTGKQELANFLTYLKGYSPFSARVSQVNEMIKLLNEAKATKTEVVKTTTTKKAVKASTARKVGR